MGSVYEEEFDKIAHDIKSPITAIKAELALLIKYSGKLSSQKLLTLLKKIDRNVSVLNRNLNYFLELEKLNKGKTKILYEFIKLDEYIEEISEKFSIKLKKAIKLKGKTKLSLISDKKNLETVLYVLVKGFSNRHVEIDIKPARSFVSLTLSGGSALNLRNLEYIWADMMVGRLGGVIKFGENTSIQIPLKPKKSTL
jgi:K+-sensing histidine kinase KdpD